MALVTHQDKEYSCTTAIKGEDYIHLLDEDGELRTAFDGVSDFSGFSITDGDWTSPTPEEDCYVAVVKDDGTMGKGGHKCSDILPKSGGTMNGKVEFSGNNNGVYVENDKYKMGFYIGSGGENRGIYDTTKKDWAVYADADNNVHLNGTADKALTLGSDVLKVITTTVTTSEIAAGGYLSQQTVSAAQETGYKLLYPLNAQSDSSYTLVYALWKNETADKYGFSLRNLSEKAVKPTLSIRGLYVKTS